LSVGKKHSHHGLQVIFDDEAQVGECKASADYALSTHGPRIQAAADYPAGHELVYDVIFSGYRRAL
jgi:hypothetical protein